MADAALSSVRERLVRVVVDRVAQAIAPIALLRQPVTPVSREQSPALVLQLESDEAISTANDRSERALVLRFVAVVRGDDAFAVADRLLIQAHAVLFADLNLGGLALAVRALDVSWEAEDADAGAFAVAARYELRYRTFSADLTAPG
jgi:hypothetical protein